MGPWLSADLEEGRLAHERCAREGREETRLEEGQESGRMGQAVVFMEGQKKTRSRWFRPWSRVPWPASTSTTGMPMTWRATRKSAAERKSCRQKRRGLIVSLFSSCSSLWPFRSLLKEASSLPIARSLAGDPGITDELNFSRRHPRSGTQLQLKHGDPLRPCSGRAGARAIHRRVVATKRVPLPSCGGEERGHEAVERLLPIAQERVCSFCGPQQLLGFRILFLRRLLHAILHASDELPCAVFELGPQASGNGNAALDIVVRFQHSCNEI
eukprot:scaffold733_cov267-Pinguiococcus_pyrenoidosus.AAC.7